MIRYIITLACLLSPAAGAVELPTERLQRLDPSDPGAYFLLAEEVAVIPTQTDAERAEVIALAQQLFVLAFELEATGTLREGTAPSVCLALATLAEDTGERRWLRALARSTDRRERVEPDWSPPSPGSPPDQTAYQLATAIGLVRSGDGRRAEAILSEPGVDRLFDETEPILIHAGRHPGKRKILIDIETWPACPQCYLRGMNTRTIRRDDRTVLCPTCGGNPGPRLTRGEFIQQLRYESILLNGAHGSWSAQLIVDDRAPLRDLDPHELAAFYRVDPAKPHWRNGEWVAAADPISPDENAP